uniref:KIB1-4 beta-propeller domain-containing protein n=1 Tax=Oryza punctata TaxID=4537 RepID=A0A0E0MHC6_ORYPU
MSDEQALPPPPSPPIAGAAVAHLALPDGKLFTFPETADQHHVHGGDRAGYVAACDGWLLFDDEEFDVLRLTSPLTGKTRLLPGLSDDGVRIRDNAIEVVDALRRDGNTGGQSDADAEEMSVQKLVMSPDDVGLVAAVVGREHFAKVALCTMEGFSWSLSARDRWRWYDDMAFHDGRLYALTHTEDLVAFDVGYEDTGEPVVSRVEHVVHGDRATWLWHTRMHYLVTSLAGPLLMVTRIMPDAGMTQRFAVFVPDLASSRWVEVNRLDAGGEALYVGRLSSRAVPSLDDADKIFLLDDTDGMSFRMERQPRSPYHAAIYDMAGRNVSELLPRQPLVDGKTPEKHARGTAGRIRGDENGLSCLLRAQNITVIVVIK